MRKTTVNYEGGRIGAYRRLGYAATKHMITPFTADEATEYLEFLDDRKATIKILYRRVEDIIVRNFPDSEVEFDKPDNFSTIGSMVKVLREAKAGNRLDYTPVMAKALVDYVNEMTNIEASLYDFISVSK